MVSIRDPSTKGAELEYPGHLHLGLKASQRRCTDVLWLILFVLGWCLMASMLIGAMTSGDPARIWRGTDYLGNVCARRGPNVPENPYKPWSDLTELFLPVKVNITDGEVHTVTIGDALSVGVCVSSCPQAGDAVMGYDGHQLHRSMFDHVLVMGRCIPIFDLYDVCEYNHCLDNATTDFNVVFDAGTFFFRGVASLQSFKWVVVMCTFQAFIMTLLWLLLIKTQKFVRPFAIISVTLLQLMLLTAAVMLWVYATGVNQTTFSALYKFGSFVLFCVAFAFFCVILYIRKRFGRAVSLVQVASSTQVSMPSLSLITPLSLVVMVPFLLIAFMLATWIQTIGLEWHADNATDVLPTMLDTVAPPTQIPTVDPDTDANTTDTAANTTDTGHNVFEPPWWKFPAHGFNIWMFLWMSVWVRHISYMVIATGCASWYWSAPSGRPKAAPIGVLCRCLGVVCRYHGGTAAVGALLTMFGFFLKLLLKPLEVLLQGHRTCGFAFACQMPALFALAYVTDLVSTSAYIMTALLGDSFITGAHRSLFLIKSNIFHVGSIHFVSECIMFFGKVSLTGSCVLSGWFLLEYTGLSTLKQDAPDGITDNATSAILIPLFVIGFLAWIVISVFSAAMQVCIETLILCFCYDIYTNDGSDTAPVFMPTNLKLLMKQQLSWHLTHEAHILHETDDYRGAVSGRSLNAKLAASDFFATEPVDMLPVCFDGETDSSGVGSEACSEADMDAWGSVLGGVGGVPSAAFSVSVSPSSVRGGGGHVGEGGGPKVTFANLALQAGGTVSTASGVSGDGLRTPLLQSAEASLLLPSVTQTSSHGNTSTHGASSL